MDALAEVFRYHQETKHHFFRYARSLGYMDWANQPDPFRRFDGAPFIPLPILKPEEAPQAPLYEDLFAPGGRVSAQPVTIRSLSRFLEYALSITAWKQAGEVRWALRSNPSSGNLHPTEGYVLIDGLTGLGQEPSLYHYLSKDHALERRAEGDGERWAQFMRPFPAGSFFFGLSSIHWREAWKYGERAFRYCQHDLGHAIGAASMAAAALGWRLTLLQGMSDAQVAGLLGLDREEDFGKAEREHPGTICLVRPRQGEDPRGRPASLPLRLEWPDQPVLTRWHGQANRLSADHPVDWEIIETVAQASWKAASEQTVVAEGRGSARRLTEPGLPCDYPGQPSAGDIIHQRRSALAFDGKTAISAPSFFLMLARVMPQAHRSPIDRPAPWDAIPWDPAIHLALFVHRVEGVASGLYLLLRDPATEPTLRAAMLDSFEWAKPEGCPERLPLFRLQEGDARKVATQVSCGQDIAGDGAFALGMIADFEGALRGHGPWFYRRLFWEAGVIGQILYLEAEAAGVRSTGIGCYFDDPVHQLLGLKDSAFQSLYHFTVGGAVEDPRLTTLPPYAIPV